MGAQTTDGNRDGLVGRIPVGISWCDTSRTALGNRDDAREKLRCLKVGSTKTTSLTTPQCGDMSRMTVTQIKADWQAFYKAVFDLKYSFFDGSAVNFDNVQVPNNNRSDFTFLQLMPKNLTYEDMHGLEILTYGTPQDYGYGWSMGRPTSPYDINVAADERQTTNNYAIWHAGQRELDSNIYAGKTSDWIINYVRSNNIKTTTRLEEGIFALYMNWKCGVIVNKKYQAYATGSRDFSGNPLGVHWDATPQYDRFCSFSHITADSNPPHVDLRPREVTAL
jgi:hypothetical protein